MSNGPALRIALDEAAGSVTILDGERVLVGWQHAERHAIPHWYPLYSPSGRDLVQQHPARFPHHRAVWIADKVQLGDGPVVDFYHCTRNQLDPNDPGQGHRHVIRQEGLSGCRSDGDRAEFESRLSWRAEGAPVLDDRRRTAVQALDRGEYLVDLDWRLTASHGDVHFHSDWIHYGWPFLRIHPQFSVEQGGRLVDDVGRVGQAATNGQYANWVDDSNTVDGVTEGVAVFLPQDGTWRKWLTRDYGTFGPRRPDHLSGRRFTLANGDSLAGSARLFVHRGDEVGGQVAARYRDYVEQAQ